jgi:hypothetical protein
MSTNRTINILLALLIAMGMSTSYLLDGPDDIATAQAVADDLASAKKAAAHIGTKTPIKSATTLVATNAQHTRARP